MKKTLLLLISFFMFITFTNASETVGCTIQKETNNLIDYKKGDIVEVNVVTDFYSEFGTLDKAKIQLYYNPYVFELLSDYNDESVYIEEGYKISEFNTYSSIINFEIKNVTGKNMLVNGGDILISKLKFKVKEDASLGQTTIELIDNSEFYIKGSSESFNCFNSKLIYNITDTPSNKIDSTLSFIKDKSSYLIGKYNPNTTTYQIDTYNSELKLDTYCSSSECSTEISGCADSVCKFKEGQNKITITNTVEDSKTTYTLNINYIKESDVEYKFPNLKKLSVENFKFLEEFNPDTFNYHLVVPSTVDSLLIDYDADNDVTVEIIGVPLIIIVCISAIVYNIYLTNNIHTAINNKNYTVAEQMIDDYQDSNPSRADVYELYAELYLAQDKPQKAIEKLQEGISHLHSSDDKDNLQNKIDQITKEYKLDKK